MNQIKFLYDKISLIDMSDEYPSHCCNMNMRKKTTVLIIHIMITYI